MITFFNRKPERFERIDDTLSRSAQPSRKNLNWLKKHGVTDVINLCQTGINDERIDVEKRGMHYHSLPTDVYAPSEKNVGKFLDIVDTAKQQGRKVHIHDRNGSVRSEIYKYVYRGRESDEARFVSQEKMLRLMHYQKVNVPDLIGWLNKFLTKGK